MSAHSKYGGDQPIRQRLFGHFDSRKSPVKGCESGKAKHGQELLPTEVSYDWFFAPAVFRSRWYASFQPRSTVGTAANSKPVPASMRTCLGAIPGAATTSKTAWSLSADVDVLSAVEVYRESRTPSSKTFGSWPKRIHPCGTATPNDRWRRSTILLSSGRLRATADLVLSSD